MKGPRPLDALSIVGFKSFKNVEKLDLHALTVIIGANGAGKSNLVSLFRLLAELVDGNLQVSVAKAGGPEALLHYGSKVTDKIVAFFQFGTNGYGFRLEPSATNQIFFANEAVYWGGNFWLVKGKDALRSIGKGHLESKLKEAFDADRKKGGKNVPSYVYPSVKSWTVYHFHDTGGTAAVKKRHDIADSARLRPDARNLAAVLYSLRSSHASIYSTIRNTVRLAVPFFDDFEVDPLLDNPQQTELRWRQTDTDYLFRGSQLSDGTLRFMCLVTALLQPHAPSTLIIDEPELGLHPYALTLLANLVKQAATRTQVILCTQSPILLSEFAPEDVVVAENVGGATDLRRVSSDQLTDWLDDYTLGELWQKNLLGGRPGR